MSVLATADHLTDHLAASVLAQEPAASSSAFKRMLDITAALTGILLCSWLFVAIALLVKATSRGPVLFKQQRLGLNRQPFTIYKFRTMYANADDALRHNVQRAGLLYKDLNDPRLTRVGRWLRRNSLDELPQLFNILMGDMCLVGPRPLPMEDTKYYEEWQWGRLAVVPGLTGLWQVSGRSRLNSDQMVRLDLYYIENWTPWLDVFIIIKTFWVVLTRDGAY